MPFSGSTYSLPAAAFVTHTAIKASPANMDFIDIGNALSTSYTTTLAATRGTSAQHPLIYPTNCRLILASSSVITLMPYNGNYLWIDGQPRLIPAAGVSLTLSGLTVGTLYYVYAIWSGTAIELILSTVVPAQRSDNGFWVQFGGNGRSLVGVFLAATSSTTLDNIRQRMLASWYNPPVRALVGTTMSAVNVNDTSPSTISVTGTLALVRFANRPGKIQFQGYAASVGSAGNIFITLGFNNIANSYDTISVKNNTVGINTPFSVMAPPFEPGSDITDNVTIFPVGYSDFGSADFTGSLRGWII